jgi:hypothetical protein
MEEAEAAIAFFNKSYFDTARLEVAMAESFKTLDRQQMQLRRTFVNDGNTVTAAQPHSNTTAPVSGQASGSNALHGQVKRASKGGKLVVLLLLLLLLLSALCASHVLLLFVPLHSVPTKEQAPDARDWMCLHSQKSHTTIGILKLHTKLAYLHVTEDSLCAQHRMRTAICVEASNGRSHGFSCLLVVWTHLWLWVRHCMLASGSVYCDAQGPCRRCLKRN